MNAPDTTLNAVSAVSDATVLPPAAADLRGPTRTGYVLIGLLLALLLGWGVFAEIAGAVLAAGRVAVESGPKRIQHKEGGIVSEVLVRGGDRVKAGQVLARLDGTTAKAYGAVVGGQVAQMRARQLRLQAEADGSWVMAVPPAAQLNAEFNTHLEVERGLLRRQKLLRDQARAQLQEQIAQAGKEITSLEAQSAAFDQQYTLKMRELEALRKTRADGYLTATALSVHEREAERLLADRGEVGATIARARSQVSALKTQWLQVDVEAQRAAMAELNDVIARLGRLQQEDVAARDTLQRIELLSPVDGSVQQVSMRTKDGVLAPGATLMVVVPDQDALVVEALIDPLRVDQVRVGAQAWLRFSAFDANTTPEALARVESLTTDTEVDERTGASHYRARLQIDSAALPASVRQKLVAGMPVDVQIQTTARSAISYLMKPLTDHLQRAFADD